MVADLRPRGIGEILDAAVTLYRARFVRLILVAAAIVVPLQVVTTLVALSAQTDNSSISFVGTSGTGFTNNSASLQLGSFAIVLLVTVVSSGFIVGLCTRIVADAYVERTEATGAAARLVGRRLFTIVVTSIVVAISEVAGFFACFVGVAVPLTLFAVAVPAIILEDAKAFPALGRSVVLTRAHFFRVLGLVLTSLLLAAVLSVGLTEAINVWLRHGASATTGTIAKGIAGAIAQVLTTPFTATATVVLYFDLRIRNEGFDVQLTMQRNDARHALAAAPGGVRTAS